jgi:hypothetical protein
MIRSSEHRPPGGKDVSVLSRPQLLDTPENSYFNARSVGSESFLNTAYIHSHKRRKYVDPSSSGAPTERVFDRVGFFDTSFDACEDVRFNYRCARRLPIFHLVEACGSLLSAVVARRVSGKCRYGTGRSAWREFPEPDPGLDLRCSRAACPSGILSCLLGDPVSVPRYVIAYACAVLVFTLAICMGWMELRDAPAAFSSSFTRLGLGILARSNCFPSVDPKGKIA